MLPTEPADLHFPCRHPTVHPLVPLDSGRSESLSISHLPINDRSDYRVGHYSSVCTHSDRRAFRFDDFTYDDLSRIRIEFQLCEFQPLNGFGY